MGGGMMPSPSAIHLLADLHALGIDVQVLGGAIRYRPTSAMPPVLMDRLRTHKAELLVMLNTDSAVADLRHFVSALWKDYAWRSAWEDRFREANYASLESLLSVLNIIIDLAEEHHRRHHWKAFISACQYLHRVASGEEWDKANPMQDKGR